MRALVATLALAAVAVPAAPAYAADNPGKRVWLVEFVPTGGARPVGEGVPRDGDYECEKSCGSGYLDPSASSPVRFTLNADVAGCDEPPCDMAVAPREGSYGFTGTLRWDGTTYTGKGFGAYAAGEESCARMLPRDTDVLTFTVDGDTLTGTATVLTGWFADTAGGATQECTRLRGYELYDGTITGRATRAAGSAASATAAPGGPAPVGFGGGPPRALTAAEARRTAVETALRAHERPALSVAVADARSLPWRPSRVALSALLALLLVLLMPFPAALFNATLGANYDEVRGWFRWLPRRDPSGPPRERGPTWLRFLGVVGAAAVLNSLLDPRLRLDAASAETVGALALSIAVVSLLAVVPAWVVNRERPHVEVLPLGLAVAAFCVLVSRLTSFEPGYLYGVIAGLAFTREMARSEKGRLAFTTSAFLLLAAVVAFVVRIPVHEAAADGGRALVLLDTVLAAVFAAGIEANVLGLLPLRFLPGENVLAWRRAAWAAAFGLSVFAFLHALSAKAGHDSATTSVVVAAVLFGVFGTVSVAFWAWFRFRPSDPTPMSV